MSGLHSLAALCVFMKAYDFFFKIDYSLSFFPFSSFFDVRGMLQALVAED